ncbi:MAG: tetratricopeptide repeat protein [Promethearchaeota archaeon]
MTDKRLEKAIEALEEGKPLEAVQMLESLAQSDEDDADVLVYLGIAYVQSEMPEKAVEVLQRADDLIEEHSVVSMFLGHALRILGRYEEAEDELRRAIRLDPGQPEPWVDLARTFYSMNEYGGAVCFLEDAVEKFPQNREMRGLLALSLYRLGDFTTGAEQWAELLRLEPDLMSAISNYAYLMLIQNRPCDAEPFVGKAVTLAPNDYRSLILLGELRFQSGDHEGARECFLKALEDDPENVEALARLGVLAHHLRQPNLVHQYLEKAEAAVSEETGSWRCLCYAYLETGQTRNFLDCLVRWSESDPGAAAPWVELAVEYDKQGLLEHSRNAWRNVFELRRYVKIACSECHTCAKKTYDSEAGFDIYADIVCPKCGALIKMPFGLSKV